jgi:hypothetical protein
MKYTMAACCLGDLFFSSEAFCARNLVIERGIRVCLLFRKPRPPPFVINRKYLKEAGRVRSAAKRAVLFGAECVGILPFTTIHAARNGDIFN